MILKLLAVLISLEAEAGALPHPSGGMSREQAFYQKDKSCQYTIKRCLFSSCTITKRT